VTGGAGSQLKEAASEGVDTFVTGEGPHWTFAQAEELGINVLYGGHYATETFGVKALAAELARRFKVHWTFIDYPTGLCGATIGRGSIELEHGVWKAIQQLKRFSGSKSQATRRATRNALNIT